MKERSVGLAVALAAAALAGGTALAPHADSATTACEEPVVAILDTGIDADHPEFQPDQVVAWKDFVGNWETPYDDHGHGTATASLAAGEHVGVRPGTSLIVGKVLNRAGSGSFNDIADGIDWAVAEGADVVSMSIGTLGPDPGLLRATSESISRAHDAGVLVITSAGNSYVVPSETPSPGNHRDIFAVGSVNENGSPSTYSNLNPEVAAWGTEVTTGYRDGTYRTWSGTSFAAPKVAGWSVDVMAAACAQGMTGTDVPDATEHALKATATDTWRLYPEEGHGIVDAESAAEAAARVGDPDLAGNYYNGVANTGSDLVRTVLG